MKRILYVFDDINYMSGAQKATFYQMDCLRKQYIIDVLSLSKPDKMVEVPGRVLVLKQLWEETDTYTCSFREIMLSKRAFLLKIKRALYVLAMRLGCGEYFLEHFLYNKIEYDLESYDVIIVVSEASKLKELIGKLKKPKKLQWIHTDYAAWSGFSEWTKMVTKKDPEIYKRFDIIVALSEHCKQGLVNKIPSIDNKVIVIPNLVNIKEICKKAEESSQIKFPEVVYKFITVGRIDREKNFDGILKVCKKLRDDGIDYCWFIVGDGPMRKNVEQKIKEYNLSDNVKMLGRLENPYPLMKNSDYFVLLSTYEGTPVTIDECAVLKVPVIATAVGGVREQMERYGTGDLLELTDDIYEKFLNIITTHREIEKGLSIETLNRINKEKIVRVLEDR